MRYAIGGLLVILSLYAFDTVSKLRIQAKDSAQWLAVTESIGPLNSTVCSRKPQLPYLLKSDWFPMPTDSVIEKCEERGVEYILITDFERKLRPRFFLDFANGRIGKYQIYKSGEYFALLQLNDTLTRH